MFFYTSGSQSEVPGQAALTSLGNLLEMQILSPYPRPVESETPGKGPSNLFLQALQVSLTHSKVWEPPD